MAFSWQVVLLLLSSYLLGSIPFGLIVSRLKGVDIRKHGSGNLGATNVGRVLGRKWGVLVLLLDAGKGTLTSTIAGAFLARLGGPWMATPAHGDLILLGSGLCCLIGNIAPCYLHFKGGKGVAVSMGLIFGIYPYLTFPGLVAVIVWAAVTKVSGYVSLGSISAACILPIAFVGAAWALDWTLADHYPLFCLTLGVAALVLLRHRANIGRLLAGTESKIGQQRP
jgi:acyl phosphate:glycerol-3-phosphate acyltransferase